MKKISVVIPMYYEEEVVDICYKRVVNNLKKLSDKYNYEIINIDKTILNNQVLININIKTNLKYIENNIYKVNIKINELTLLDYIFMYLRGKKWKI